MVYHALIESQFLETIEQAKRQIKDENYGNVADSLKIAGQLIERLPNPQNLPERIQYSELKSGLYKKLSDSYALVSNRGPLVQSDIEKERDLIRHHLEEIAEGVKSIGYTLNEDDEDKTIENLGEDPILNNTLCSIKKLLGFYSENIENYKDRKEKEVESELLDKLREPVTKLAGVMGITRDKPIESIDTVPGIIGECADKLEDIMRV